MSRIVLVNQSSTPDDAGSGNAQLFIEGNELYQQVGTGDKTKVANETTSTFTSPLSVPSISAVNTCKAWANIDGTAAAASMIRDSFNISSMTDHATGNYTFNFGQPMVNNNYCALMGHSSRGTQSSQSIYSTFADTPGSALTYADCFKVGSVEVVTGRHGWFADGDFAHMSIAIFSN